MTKRHNSGYPKICQAISIKGVHLLGELCHKEVEKVPAVNKCSGYFWMYIISTKTKSWVFNSAQE